MPSSTAIPQDSPGLRFPRLTASLIFSGMLATMDVYLFAFCCYDVVAVRKYGQNPRMNREQVLRFVRWSRLVFLSAAAVGTALTASLAAWLGAPVWLCWVLLLRFCFFPLFFDFSFRRAVTELLARPVEEFESWGMTRMLPDAAIGARVEGEDVVYDLWICEQSCRNLEREMKELDYGPFQNPRTIRS